MYIHTHIYMYAHTHTHLVVEGLELLADFLSMTIAPLGQHTYDGCLIRALCVVVRWEGEGGGERGGGRCGRRKFNRYFGKWSANSMQLSIKILMQ